MLFPHKTSKVAQRMLTSKLLLRVVPLKDIHFHQPCSVVCFSESVLPCLKVFICSIVLAAEAKEAVDSVNSTAKGRAAIPALLALRNSGTLLRMSKSRYFPTPTLHPGQARTGQGHLKTTEHSFWILFTSEWHSVLVYFATMLKRVYTSQR